ncbi:hydroxyacid dehydrogenase [Litoreibacter roseus]|uniref:(S)-sulfolactate dehydrogenase n=1 Tax=Litoreibacter roseus TaxID=2601869 RepID=A0A6N6JF49_9RHOB|nr:hydroxyacid dehydrogenase [Litoreibacter roseus]GFE64971.1 hypothetical protein KIN_20450 [Litoreibacter roseus]
MKKVIISEFMDEASVDELRQTYDVLYDPGLVDTPDSLFQALGDADALIVRNRTQVKEQLLSHAPNLKAVGRLGVGLDNIDLDLCAARGIAVHPASGANDLAVAEYVLSTAMSLLRRAYNGFDRMVAGEWPRQDMAGYELSGKTLGLVGFGSIARQTAGKAHTLGMSVEAYDPFVSEKDPIWAHAGRRETLLELATSVDVLSLHVPLTEDTYHIVNADLLDAMHPKAVLINAARGGVVDEVALAMALRNGRLGGAALDVFETEPLTAEAAAKFKDLTNLILTPHIAGVTQEANVRVSALTAQNVRRTLVT